MPSRIIFFFNSANKTQYIQVFFMLGKIIKIFISSILQRRPRIFKESFLLGRMIKIFISSNLQRRPRIFKEFFMLGRLMKIFFFSILQRSSIFKDFFAWYNNKDINFFKSGKKTKDFLKIFSLLLVE